MHAKIAHDFLTRLWPTVGAAIVAFATLALAASQIWPEAKSWTASKFAWAVDVVFNPLFFWFSIAVFIIWLLAYIWSGHVVEAGNSAPVRFAEPPAPVAKKPPQSVKGTSPLNDHFLNDFKDGAGGVIIAVNLYQDIEFPDGLKVQIFYNQELNFAAHAKFLVVYVPRCNRTIGVARYVADNVKDYFHTGDLGFAIGGVGTEETKADNLVFTGKVFIYHEDSLPLSQRGDLDTYYLERGLVLQLRSSEYVLSCSEAAKASDAS